MLMPALTFQASKMKNGNSSYIQEQQRRQKMPPADRKFFDFLQKEGNAKFQASRFACEASVLAN